MTSSADLQDLDNFAPAVSVVLISYEQQAFIADALDSVLGQDYPNLEVVVADDASTDGTAEIIADYARRHPARIKPIFNQQNVGMTRNCNIALKHCTGKYVAFLAGDDLLLPGKISAQVAWFKERARRALCGHQVEVFYETGAPPHPFGPLRKGAGAADIIRYGTFAACSTMVRADRIPSYGFDERLELVSDFTLWVDVLADGGEYGYVPGTYARYRRHSANISGNIPANVAEAARALDLIVERYPQYADACYRARARLIHYPLGNYRLERGERRAARKEFLEALAIVPTSTGLWRALIKTVLPI